MAEENEAASTSAADSPAAPEAGPVEVLTAKLAGYDGPVFRKAYLASFLEAASRFRSAGNTRGEEYCLAKVASALGNADPGPAGFSQGGKAAGDRRDAAAEKLGGQWRSERLSAAENILSRHGGMLSALEYRVFGEKLGKLRESAGAGPAAAKADTMLLELRRRLYARVLKSRKVALKRMRMPVSLARLAVLSPGASEAPGSGLPVTIAPSQASPSQPPIGPYNDRLNMEDVLALVADADATWVEEFLDLYRGLAGLKGIQSAPASAKK